MVKFNLFTPLICRLISKNEKIGGGLKWRNGWQKVTREIALLHGTMFDLCRNGIDSTLHCMLSGRAKAVLNMGNGTCLNIW